MRNIVCRHVIVVFKIMTMKPAFTCMYHVWQSLVLRSEVRAF